MARRIDVVSIVAGVREGVARPRDTGGDQGCRNKETMHLFLHLNRRAVSTPIGTLIIEMYRLGGVSASRRFIFFHQQATGHGPRADHPNRICS